MFTTKLLESWCHPDHDLKCHCTRHQRPVRSRMFIAKLAKAVALRTPRGRDAKKQEQEQKMGVQRKRLEEMRNAYAKQEWQRLSRHIRILPRDLKLIIFEYWIVNNPPSIEMNWKTCSRNEDLTLLARMNYSSLYNGHLSHMLLTGMSEDDYPTTLYNVLFHTVPLQVVVSVDEYKSWKRHVWTQDIQTMKIVSDPASFLQLHDRMCLPKRKRHLRFHITVKLPLFIYSLAFNEWVPFNRPSQAHFAEDVEDVTICCNLRVSGGCSRDCMAWALKFCNEFLELGIPKTGIAIEVMPTPRAPRAS